MSTFIEIQEFLDLALEKVKFLTPASFGKFTAPNLPDDYLYNKWISKKKSFCDVWGNLDSTHKELFIKYCGVEQDKTSVSIYVLDKFFQWAYNWDADSYAYNAFDKSTNNGKILSKLITGKEKPQGISDTQIITGYVNLNADCKQYLIRAAFGKKKEVANA